MNSRRIVDFDWWIFVLGQTPEERAAAGNDLRAALAVWEAIGPGLDWIEALVNEGKATQLLASGYPSRYAAIAGAVVPLVINGPSQCTGPAVSGDDNALWAAWTGSASFFRDRIERYPPARLLTIEVWDQSCRGPALVNL